MLIPRAPRTDMETEKNTSQTIMFNVHLSFLRSSRSYYSLFNQKTTDPFQLRGRVRMITNRNFKPYSVIPSTQNSPVLPPAKWWKKASEPQCFGKGNSDPNGRCRRFLYLWFFRIPNTCYFQQVINKWRNSIHVGVEEPWYVLGNGWSLQSSIWESRQIIASSYDGL